MGGPFLEESSKIVNFGQQCIFFILTDYFVYLFMTHNHANQDYLDICAFEIL